MNHAGVLGCGSILVGPGDKLLEATLDTINDVMTPFTVEYSRSSSKRGGGPTLVPVEGGGRQVLGAILVMRPQISLQKARDRL